jgi:hypothetical protein
VDWEGDAADRDAREGVVEDDDFDDGEVADTEIDPKDFAGPCTLSLACVEPFIGGVEASACGVVAEAALASMEPKFMEGVCR